MSTTPDTTTKHNYTYAEILEAWNQAGPPIAGEPTMPPRFRRFLAALRERPQAQPGPWPGQQEAIDKAFAACAITPLTTVLATRFFKQESTARLAIAQAYDAARPQAAEIARLKDDLIHAKNAVEDLMEERDKAQAELAALRQPIQSDAGISLGSVVGNSLKAASFLNKEPAECYDFAGQSVIAAARPAIEAECLAQAVRRMESVPVSEMWNIWGGTRSLTELRARLIAAAKGEGQTQEVPPIMQGIGSVKPNPNSEIKPFGYIQWHDGTCQPLNKPAVVNEPPQDEKQPDLSGESEKQTEPAQVQLDADGARKACNGLDAEQRAELLSTAKAVIGGAQPWTPAVGDLVRLKSGGPVMTVVEIRQGDDVQKSHVVWITEEGRVSGIESLSAACLTPAKP